jgi:hypothetical protein
VLLCLDHLLNLSCLDLLLLLLKVELLLVLSFFFLGPVSFTSHLLVVHLLLSDDVLPSLFLHGSVSVNGCVFLLLLHLISHILLVCSLLISLSLPKDVVGSLPSFIDLFVGLVFL